MYSAAFWVCVAIPAIGLGPTLREVGCVDILLIGAAGMMITCMSKAFTKESDARTRTSTWKPPRMRAAGRAELHHPGRVPPSEEELAGLWEVERPKLETIAWAASNGDRSENADYIWTASAGCGRWTAASGFFLSGSTAPRCALQRRAGRGRRSPTATGPGSSAASIVGMDEQVLPARGRVLADSPIAKALLKAREGDVVTLRTPAGAEEIEVLEVRYELG